MLEEHGEVNNQLHYNEVHKGAMQTYDLMLKELVGGDDPFDY